MLQDTEVGQVQPHGEQQPAGSPGPAPGREELLHPAHAASIKF